MHWYNVSFKVGLEKPPTWDNPYLSNADYKKAFAFLRVLGLTQSGGESLISDVKVVKDES